TVLRTSRIIVRLSSWSSTMRMRLVTLGRLVDQLPARSCPAASRDPLRNVTRMSEYQMPHAQHKPIVECKNAGECDVGCGSWLCENADVLRRRRMAFSRLRCSNLLARGSPLTSY